MIEFGDNDAAEVDRLVKLLTDAVSSDADATKASSRTHSDPGTGNVAAP